MEFASRTSRTRPCASLRAKHIDSAWLWTTTGSSTRAGFTQLEQFARHWWKNAVADITRCSTVQVSACNVWCAVDTFHKNIICLNVSLYSDSILIRSASFFAAGPMTDLVDIECEYPKSDFISCAQDATNQPIMTRITSVNSLPQTPIILTETPTHCRRGTLL